MESCKSSIQNHFLKLVHPFHTYYHVLNSDRLPLHFGLLQQFLLQSFFFLQCQLQISQAITPFFKPVNASTTHMYSQDKVKLFPNMVLSYFSAPFLFQVSLNNWWFINTKESVNQFVKILVHIPKIPTNAISLKYPHYTSLPPKFLFIFENHAASCMKHLLVSSLKAFQMSL